MNNGSICAQVTYNLEKFANFDGKNMIMYCNSIIDKPNHAVSIVGWDDNYAIENFKEGVRPSKPGAYIVSGSYGSGDDSPFAEELDIDTYTGYDYISYEDYWIESFLVGIASADNVDYDYLYQHDVLGANDAISLQDQKVLYGANKFTKQSSEVEQFNEVSLHVWDPTATYDIYVNASSDSLSFNNLTKVKTVSALTPGYNTIKFDNPIYLTGSKFAVVVKVSVSSGTAIIAMETPDEIYYTTAKAGSNESFIAIDESGEWLDIANIPQFLNTNLCIKAFTSKAELPNIPLNSSKYDIDRLIKGTKASGRN